MPQPPAPLRGALGLLLLLYASPTFRAHGCIYQRRISTAPYFDVSAWHMPFMGLALFLAIHTASLRSPLVSACGSLTLVEHAVYYSLMQATLIASLEILITAAWHTAAVWHTAAYTGLYFAWHIHSTARTMENCTLSTSLLSLVLFVFCFGWVPLCVLHRTTMSQDNDTVLAAHLVAIVLSDVCAFAQQTLQPLLPQFRSSSSS